MILACAADDFGKFRKIRKIINFQKFIKNLPSAKCQVFGVFQVDEAGLQSPVLESDKHCTQNAYFLRKVDFCIFEPKNREVIENSSITPLNFSPLQYTYLGKNSYQYH